MKKGKVFIVAELSANHNGSIEIAKETIKAARKAGADAIKLQTYLPETMTIDSELPDFTINNGSIWDGENYFSLYKKAYTPWEWHKELFDVAKAEGLVCFSTPFDRSAVDFLESLDNPIYKIASFEITDINLIEYVASKGKPIIISTGIANKNDIDLAIKTIRKTGNDQITVLKCTSSYPAPLNEANLSLMAQIKKEFNVEIGLSDHTLGVMAPVVATSLGARVIEKHFILEKSIGGPDASFSLEPPEFKEMVEAVRMAESSLGNAEYNLTKKQFAGRQFSRSLYIIKDVSKGEIISLENVKAIRPGFGLHPKYLNEILGKKFKSSFQKGTRLTEKSIENFIH